MILAVPIKQNSIEAQIADKFSRCPYFALIDKQKGNLSIINNTFNEQKSGAGPSVAKYLVNTQDVTAFMAFELGLKVQQWTYKNKIQLILIDDKKITLKDILKLMKINTKTL